MASAQRFLARHDGNVRWLVDERFAPAFAALAWPEATAVTRALGDAASAGRTATSVLALPDRPERIHLRPVRHGGLLGPVWGSAMLGTRRPESELRVNAALLAAGAPVPQPVLSVAHRLGGPLWSAVFGTVHVEDARDGIAWLTAAPEGERWLRGLRAVGAAIRRFHDAGGQHGDLHAKNLLLCEREGETRALVIDLDGARIAAPPPPERRMRELMRLVRGLHKRGLAQQVGARGCAIVFASYCAGDRSLRRALLAHLPREQRRIARHRWAWRTNA